MECPICFYNWNQETAMPIILSCGHSICIECSKSLFDLSKIVCPTCSIETAFPKKKDGQTDSDYLTKCIDSLTKNYTLLSLMPSKSSVRVKREFKYGMRCKDHNLIIHSYVAKPYSMLCDNCLDEISQLNLKIIPFPEVIKICKDNISLLKKNLEILSQDNENIEDSADENLTNKLVEHFGTISKFIKQTHNDAVTKLIEKIKLFKDDAKTKYKKYEEIASKIKINEQKYLYYSKLPLGELIQEKSKIESLLAQSRESIPNEIPSLSIDISLNKDSLNLFKDHLKNSLKVTLQKSSNEKWTCKYCNSKVKFGKVQCECGSFRPLESYENILKNINACNFDEISELQQRREIEMNLINQLDISGPSDSWYIINADWIGNWRSFVFNKPTRPGVSLPEIGVLPPGPVNNREILKENGEVKPKLKPAVHYRGVNKKVWEAYVFIYGGGPPIIRKKLNIYEV